MKTATVMVFCVTGLIFSATSHAQMGHGISKNAKHVITCPVTGDKVDMDSATKSHLSDIEAKACLTELDFCGHSSSEHGPQA